LVNPGVFGGVRSGRAGCILHFVVGCRYVEGRRSAKGEDCKRGHVEKGRRQIGKGE